MASIRLSNLIKRFGALAVIKDISLDIKDGEFLVLLGPSGCGKSTLLRMLAGLENVSAGQIDLDGKRIDGLPPTERDMAFVFQSYALYPHMSVRQNIGFPLLMRHFRWWFHIPFLGGAMKRGIERSEAVRVPVEKAAKVLALTELLERLPRTLSGGQRQRVALGRAMVRQPKVFLMDEPLSNLDAKLRASMRAEISRLHRELGSTFIYVTHDQVEAMTMGTRIALLRDGTLQQLGSPRELYEDPANLYVAGFIGVPAMNLIKARYASGRITIGGVDFAVPPELVAQSLSIPEQIVIGIRPNALRLAAKDAPNSLPGTVVMVENVGAESNVAVKPDLAETVRDDDRQTGDSITITVPGYSELAPGGSVSVSLDLKDAVFFDAETGKRIRA